MRTLLCSVAIVAGLSAGAPAGTIVLTERGIAEVYHPPQLDPGNHYHLAFVTQSARDATSSDIDDYNRFVRSQAEKSKLTAGIEWFAIASTESVAARDNVPAMDDPLYRLDGGVIHPNPPHPHLWSWTHRLGQVAPLVEPIRLDQFGDIRESLVWTGSWVGGRQAIGATSSAALGSETPYVGFSGDTHDDWIQAARGYPASTLLPLYAISERLTVTAPEPPSWQSIAVMLLFAPACWWIRRHWVRWV